MRRKRPVYFFLLACVFTASLEPWWISWLPEGVRWVIPRSKRIRGVSPGGS